MRWENLWKALLNPSGEILCFSRGHSLILYKAQHFGTELHTLNAGIFQDIVSRYQLCKKIFLGMCFRMWLMKCASIGNNHGKEIFSLSTTWPGNFLAFLWKVGFIGFVCQSSQRQGVGFPPSYLPAPLRATCLKPKQLEKNVNGSPWTLPLSLQSSLRPFFLCFLQWVLWWAPSLNQAMSDTYLSPLSEDLHRKRSFR